MRAVQYRQYGPSTVLEPCALPTPVPGADDVRIRVRATTVTSAECAMRRGRSVVGRLLLGVRRPRRRFRVLGTELAGTVDAVGPRVTRFAVGDDVFGFAGFRIGANAEYICLPESASLARIPDGVGFEDAAAAVDGASTALNFLRDRAGISAGQSVLVIGASGSIGTYAVQLARHFGATVIGVCSTANIDLVRSLGAHDVIDYTKQDATAVREAYDVIFDTVGKSSFAACRAALRPGGVYASTTTTVAGLLARWWTRWFGTRRAVGGMSLDKNDELAEIGRLLEAGILRVVIDRRYPLERIAEAHDYVEGGHKRGNVVITVS